MTLRRRQAGAKAIELIVKTLAQHLELGDELAAMTHDSEERFQRRLVRKTAESLPRKPDKRGAVTIVRLETAGAELRPRRLRLRRREQAHPAGKAPLELARPRTMQRAGRLDRDQRLVPTDARTDQPHKLVDAGPQRRQRHRIV